MIVILYVDDMVFTGNNLVMFAEFKRSITKEFKMMGIGEMSYFLGIEVNQTAKGIFISQRKYARKVITNFNMGDCKSVPTPVEKGTQLRQDSQGETAIDPKLFKSLVGSLKYISYLHKT